MTDRLAGIEVVGTDVDVDMISVARAKTPEPTWVMSDLAALELARRSDVVVLAGNVVPYVAAERRQAAVLACASHLAPGGWLVAGFQLHPDWPTLEDYDSWCTEAGLLLDERLATWDRTPHGRRLLHRLGASRRLNRQSEHSNIAHRRCAAHYLGTCWALSVNPNAFVDRVEW